MELISEIKRCKTIEDCYECATIDTYDENEAASGWLTCIEEMFSKFEHVKVLGNEAILEGFDLKGFQVVAKCRNGRKSAFVSLESVEFPKLSKSEKLWLDALKKWNETF
ncbi:MAG: hypothetical protein KIT27_12450 [Legionellales bacterium]|nr:hypothetical protein [Legionellales bacterium]